MHFNNSQQLFYGIYAGYPVFVKILSNKRELLFTLFAKPSDSTTDLSLLQWYEVWQKQHQNVTQTQHMDNQLTAVIQLSKTNQTQDAVSLFSQLAETAVQNRLIPCCKECGTEYGYEQYTFEGSGICLCSACASDLERKAEQNRETLSAVRPNIAGVLLGIVLGVACLFLLTFLLLRFNAIASATGAIGAVLTGIFVKKFSGTFTIGSSVLAAIACLGVATFTPIFDTSYDLSKNIHKLLADSPFSEKDIADLKAVLAEVTPAEFDAYLADEVTYAELEVLLGNYELLSSHSTLRACMSDLGELVSHPDLKTYKSNLIRELLIGIISTLLGIVVFFPQLHNQAVGNFKFKKLDA